jgi:hypothetical protein
MKIKGFDISTEELDNDMIAINFDKDGRAGGYISLKFDDDGVVVDIFSGEGDLLGSTWTFYKELEPTDLSHEDSRL